MATGAEPGYNVNLSAMQVANAVCRNGAAIVGGSNHGDRRSVATESHPHGPQIPHGVEDESVAEIGGLTAGIAA